MTDRFFVEAGLRWEKQTGASDIGADTVDTNVFAPRLSASYDLAGDGKTLVTGSYGRYYASIIQGFSDGFAGVPQQENYDLFLWNGSAYVFSNRSASAARTSRRTPISSRTTWTSSPSASSASSAAPWAPASATSTASGTT